MVVGFTMKIIISYLQEDQKLKECLESLEKYSPELEIIKIHSDKNKTRSSEEAFQNYIDEHGMDDDLMIWHPDMKATEGWYEDLKKYYDKYDLIGCKLLYPNNLIQHYGGHLLWDGRGLHPHQHTLNIGAEDPMACAYVTGPGMVVKKHVYEKLKGWDHNFFAYIDTDFCLRARQAGFTVGVVPVTLYHSEGEDQLKKRTAQENNNILNEGHQFFITKHMAYLAKHK